MLVSSFSLRSPSATVLRVHQEEAFICRQRSRLLSEKMVAPLPAVSVDRSLHKGLHTASIPHTTSPKAAKAQVCLQASSAVTSGATQYESRRRTTIRWTRKRHL